MSEQPTFAMTVTPGRPSTADVTALDRPPGRGSILVDGLTAGVCGTDREIVEHGMGYPPHGEDRLVLGHESVGRVREAPAGSQFATGDLVAGIVRRPEPDPCEACRAGEVDACLDGRYRSRGISGLHGYGATGWFLEPEFAVRLNPGLGERGVLIEPASVLAKAWEQIDRIASRSPRGEERILVLGAGPIGLLATLFSTRRGHETHVYDRADAGIKPELVRALGATYHQAQAHRTHRTAASDLESIKANPTIVIDCTGVPALALGAVEQAAPHMIVCLIGLPEAAESRQRQGASGDGQEPLGALDAVASSTLVRTLVRRNGVLFGTVNAGHRHFQAADAALAATDRTWLDALITRRVPLSSWTAALRPRPDDVKVVVDLQR
jgi:threonine dehydrogenase-like Zn-dependent dehydrogenase